MVNMEILDAVKLMLEQDGSLRSMKAQIKSSVVNVLKGRSDINAGINDNKLVRAYLAEDNNKGLAKLSVVADLLECLGLQHTLSMFEQELGTTGPAHQAAFLSRTAAVEALGLAAAESVAGPSKPLFDDLVAFAANPALHSHPSSGSNRHSPSHVRSHPSPPAGSPQGSPLQSSSYGNDDGSVGHRGHRSAIRSITKSAGASSGASSPGSGSPDADRVEQIPHISTHLGSPAQHTLHAQSSPGSVGSSSTSSLKSSPISAPVGRAQSLTPTTQAPTSASDSPPSSTDRASADKKAKNSKQGQSTSPSAAGKISPAATGSTGKGSKDGLEDRLPSPTSSGRKSPTQLLTPVHHPMAAHHSPTGSALASPAGSTHSQSSGHQRHSSPGHLDSLLQIDTRSLSGRLGSLAPLATSLAPLAPIGGKEHKRSPTQLGSSPSSGAGSPSPLPSSPSASGPRLDESMESISESIASLSGSFDVSGSPQHAAGSSGGITGTTTFGSSHGVRGEKDLSKHGQAKVVEVQTKRERRADAQVERSAAGGTTRSKSGWESGGNSHNIDDFVFGEGVDQKSPTASRFNDSMEDTHHADEQSLEQSMEKSPVPPPRNKTSGAVYAGAGVILSDLGEGDSPLSHRVGSVSPAASSPDDKHRNNNNNQSPGSSGSNSVNGSASVDDYYGNEDFEEEEEEAYKPTEEAEHPPPKKEKPKLFMNTTAETAGSKGNSNTSQQSSSFLDATFESESDSDRGRGDPRQRNTGTAGEGKGRDQSAVSEVFVMEDIEEESVASEDIEGFNISHGSASSNPISMSDSFASLLNDSMNSQGLKQKPGKRVISVPAVGAGTSAPPPKPQRNRESTFLSSTNSLDDSHRSLASEGMEFSMTEVEISGGGGGKLDGYDFQTAALPPLKEEKRPKRRERDTGPKGGW